MSSKEKKDVQGLGGEGRLTDAKINTLQNYFSIALHQNDGDIDRIIFACKASMFHVACYYDNCLKKSKFVVPVRTGHIESILIRIKMVFNWMYVQPFFLCITTYENERIYQNIWIVVHTKRK